MAVIDPAPDLTDDVRELLAEIHELKARLFRATDCEEQRKLRNAIGELTQRVHTLRLRR